MQLTDLSFNRYKKAKPKGFVFFVLVSVDRRFPYTKWTSQVRICMEIRQKFCHLYNTACIY